MPLPQLKSTHGSPATVLVFLPHLSSQSHCLGVERREASLPYGRVGLLPDWFSLWGSLARLFPPNQISPLGLCSLLFTFSPQLWGLPLRQGTWRELSFALHMAPFLPAPSAHFPMHFLLAPCVSFSPPAPTKSHQQFLWELPGERQGTLLCSEGKEGREKRGFRTVSGSPWGKDARIDLPPEPLPIGRDNYPRPGQVTPIPDNPQDNLKVSPT
jgi:hypothetical protein